MEFRPVIHWNGYRSRQDDLDSTYQLPGKTSCRFVARQKRRSLCTIWFICRVSPILTDFHLYEKNFVPRDNYSLQRSRHLKTTSASFLFVPSLKIPQIRGKQLFSHFDNTPRNNRQFEKEQPWDCEKTVETTFQSQTKDELQE